MKPQQTTHPLPQPANTPADWAERIERARQAREAGRRMRAGKPVTFATARAERTAR